MTREQAARLVEPIRNYVLLDVDPDPSPIISVRKYRPYLRKATVIAAGQGLPVWKSKKLSAVIPTQVVPGERVLVGAFAGIEINVKGHEFLMVHDAEIMAVVEGEN